MFHSILETCLNARDLNTIRQEISKLRQTIEHLEPFTCLRDELVVAPEQNSQTPGSPPVTIQYRKDILLSDLQQIINARTVSRSQYYIERLIEGLEKIKTTA